MRWLFRSNETTNFTYNISERNTKYLAALLAESMNADFHEVMAYIEEINDDKALRKSLDDATAKSKFSNEADIGCGFGRRVGWYAIARILRPKVIVETGVDKGLGACVLIAALQRNAKEGFPGRYFGTDINPEAGYLISESHREYGEVLLGDSLDSLNNLNETVDLFINDSDHSAEYEAREYEVIEEKLSKHAVVIGDNAHVTSKLLDFSLSSGRRFVYFQEEPIGHWYKGGGIGISLPRPELRDSAL